MVSRPRQPTTTGEELIRRYDAGVRPYCLRDWQSGFGGCTLTGRQKRKFSVAYVVRPRTRTTNACLCFTLMSKMPDNKPWSRAADERDPSRGVLLDLQEDCDWKMDSTVLIPNVDPITALDDNMQVQCLPIHGAGQPEWTYRRVPKVTAFRTFARLTFWCRKPKDFTYHLCAENMTKTAIAPALPEEDGKALLEHGILPPESLARDRFCVMCPVKRGSPRLIPWCLCHNWCHISCSYQTHLGRVCPSHVQILDLRRNIIVLRHPYHEDCVVLPTRPTLCPDNKNIERDIANKLLNHCWEMIPHSPSGNLLLDKHAWLSAGLVWMQGASESGIKGVFEDSGPEGLESRPTINLFELATKE